MEKLIWCIFRSAFFMRVLITIITMFLFSCSGNATINDSAAIAPAKKDMLISKLSASLSAYADSRSFNSELALLIDLRRPSGEPRAVLMNLKTGAALDSGLVAHGRCNQYWLQGRQYGNAIGCGCSSLGKYKIGAAYNGRFGAAYKLHGLDSSNSNAFKRNVVLHAHDCVPSSATAEEICQSDGCPTLSPAFLQRLHTVIKKSRRPMLLLIYDSKFL